MRTSPILGTPHFACNSWNLRALVRYLRLHKNNTCKLHECCIFCHGAQAANTGICKSVTALVRESSSVGVGEASHSQRCPHRMARLDLSSGARQILDAVNILYFGAPVTGEAKSNALVRELQHFEVMEGKDVARLALRAERWRYSI